jgi:hypothetical protein
VVEHLTYRNLKMTNVNFPILIYASYMAPEREYRDLVNVTAEIATTYPSKPMTDRTPVYRDITFSNITATAAPDRRAGLIWGLPEAPVSNIVLQNVSIKADKPFGIYNAQGVKIGNCHVVTPEGENKFSTANAQVDLSP